jgi:hypothetical protein
MNTVEIEYPAGIDLVKIYISTQLVVERKDCRCVEFSFDDKLPVHIAVEFFPFKIKPIVRFNGFLLDYWLANIQLWDHRLEFTVSKTFYQDYKDKNIAGRIASLSTEHQAIEHFWDKFIGINNLHPELTEEIKKLIN